MLAGISGMASLLPVTVLLLAWTVLAVGLDQGPCDIYANGNTPCVAAHSLTRALYAAYGGPLYVDSLTNTQQQQLLVDVASDEGVHALRRDVTSAESVLCVAPTHGMSATACKSNPCRLISITTNMA